MDADKLRALLEQVRSGALDVEQAVQAMRSLPFDAVGDFASLDTHRALRRGFPEVIFGEGKSLEQIREIFLRLSEHNRTVMATRINAEQAAALLPDLPEAVYHPAARILYRHTPPAKLLTGIMVLCAGTTDIPVAEEAALTAELMGNRVERAYDVGVAGLHRLLDRLPLLRKARVLVVVAGMEGALPSVVAGLVSAPVIAVPTSVGYGASLNGLAALLAMLNSCANGVSVVNIDNGFGAGYSAGLINRLGQD